MTYRASQSPLVGGFNAFRDFIDREYLRIQRAFATTPELEQGAFVPTLSFDTPGDLSNSYTTQDGFWWRVGPLLHFSFHLNVTPTFTTSSGNAFVGGLPYVASANHPHSPAPIILSGTGITWPGSRRMAMGRATSGQDQLQVIFMDSGATSTAMTAADITSANAITIRMSGFYPIK